MICLSLRDTKVSRGNEADRQKYTSQQAEVLKDRHLTRQIDRNTAKKDRGTDKDTNAKRKSDGRKYTWTVAKRQK